MKTFIKFGNIFIPNRPEEAERLFAKTKSGCSLFTSQVLFEHDKAAHAINAYLKKCRQHKLNPIKFYLSLMNLLIQSIPTLSSVI